MVYGPGGVADADAVAQVAVDDAVGHHAALAGHPGGALGGDVEPGLVVADHRAAGHDQPVGAPVGDAETVVLDVAGGDPDAPRGRPHLLLQFDEDAGGAGAPGRAP